MHTNTKPLTRAIDDDELALISGGRYAMAPEATQDVIEEIVVSAQPVPSIRSFVSSWAPRTTIGTSSSAGGAASLSSNGRRRGAVLELNGQTSKQETEQTTFIDTNLDGKPDSVQEIFDAYEQFKQDFLDADARNRRE